MTDRLKGISMAAFCPRPFVAVQVYNPASLSKIPITVNTLLAVSLMLSRRPPAKSSGFSSYFFPAEGLMTVPSLSQVMEGVGTPSAVQLKLTREPASSKSSLPVELM